VTELSRFFRIAALAAAAFVFGAGTSLAACTDPPGPGVNWQRCALDGLDLTELDLEGARVRAASFLRSDLSGSNLTDAEGYQAKFITATAEKVTFDGAQLSQADFTKAKLTDSSFVGADLRNARLYRADLTGADLTDAKLDGADITRAILDGATWTDGKTVCAKGSVGRCNWR
jgi:uncharacterized protein YjbI with pentapeptide repeats